MPFGDVVLGRPGYVHGGAIAGLLEFAAFGALYEALGAARGVTVKPVNVTVQYMRGAHPPRHVRRGHRHPARQPHRQCRGPRLAARPRQADRGGADERSAAPGAIEPRPIYLRDVPGIML